MYMIMSPFRIWANTASFMYLDQNNGAAQLVFM